MSYGAIGNDNLLTRTTQALYKRAPSSCFYVVILKVLIALVARVAPDCAACIRNTNSLDWISCGNSGEESNKTRAEASERTSERAIAGGGEQHLVYFNRGSTCLRDCFVSRHHDV